jgi:gamma-glutamylputrescine oxidase
MSDWLQAAPYQAHGAASPLPARTQAAVIGGGITGASAAYWLRRLGIEVTLLEARGLAGGATGRNGGHLVAGPAVDFAEAIGRYGLEPALALYRFTLDTIEAIRAFVQAHHIECDLSLLGTACLALDSTELDSLSESAELMSRHGLPLTWWSAAECAAQTHTGAFLGGFLNPAAGKLWPARLVFGIAEQALALGARLHTQTPVQAVEREGGRLRVVTARGTIEAEQVIYAANAWTRRLLPGLAETIVPVRGQVILTDPAPSALPFGLVTDHGHIYCVQRPDGRLVLGGQRNRSSTLEIGVDDDTRLNPDVGAALRDFLPRHFPGWPRLGVQQEWTGIMAWTPDLNPMIGPLPGRPGEYLAAGYSGHGMPIAFTAGKMLAEMAAGRTPDQYLDIFRPDRFS